MRGEFGHDFIDELQPLPGETVIDKPGYGAFHQTDLAQVLQNRGIDHLILGGVTTEVCVHSTLREAVDRGYRCVLAGDACGVRATRICTPPRCRWWRWRAACSAAWPTARPLIAELERTQEAAP